VPRAQKDALGYADSTRDKHGANHKHGAKHVTEFLKIFISLELRETKTKIEKSIRKSIVKKIIIVVNDEFSIQQLTS
jgi:hypothetical protein